MLTPVHTWLIHFLLLSLSPPSENNEIRGKLDLCLVAAQRGNWWRKGEKCFISTTVVSGFFQVYTGILWNSVNQPLKLLVLTISDQWVGTWSQMTNTQMLSVPLLDGNYLTGHWPVTHHNLLLHTCGSGLPDVWYVSWLPLIVKNRPNLLMGCIHLLFPKLINYHTVFSFQLFFFG